MLETNEGVNTTQIILGGLLKFMKKFQRLISSIIFTFWEILHSCFLVILKYRLFRGDYSYSNTLRKGGGRYWFYWCFSSHYLTSFHSLLTWPFLAFNDQCSTFYFYKIIFFSVSTCQVKHESTCLSMSCMYRSYIYEIKEKWICT